MKIAKILIHTILAIKLSSCITPADTNPTKEYVEVGDEVPSFVVNGINNTSFLSPEDFEGKTTLLLFFATWCPYCQQELPELNAVWLHFKDSPDINIVAVARGGNGKYEQSRTIVEAYWSANNLSIPWYLDPNRNVFSLFASGDIPRLYLISKDGSILWKKVSPGYESQQYISLINDYKNK